MLLQSKAIEGIRVVVVLAAVGPSWPFPVMLSAQVAETQQAGVRRAAVDTRALVDQLRQGDKIVEFFLDIDDERVLPSRPLRPLESLEMAVVDSEQVVIIEVETADARLINEDRWIATRLNCKVVEVIKAPRSSAVRPGSHVSFQIGAGELEINGVVVRANRKLPYEVGRTYVAFLRNAPIPAQGLTSAVASAYPLSVDRGRLRAFPQLSEELDGLTLADVRRAAAKHR